MAEVTYLRFRNDNHRISLILFVIFVFTIIKFFTKDYKPYFGVYAFLSLLCLVTNIYFGRKATQMLHNAELRMNWFETEILKNFLITVLGVGTLYMFFVDGLYGICLLFKSFSWETLFIRIAVVVLGYKLAVSVANIQNALIWLSKDTWK